MSLHLVFSNNGWQTCQSRVNTQDCVVLLGDAVYLARQTFEHKQVFVLQQDLEIRGIGPKSEVASISYADLVNLTVQHNPVVSWHH